MTHGITFSNAVRRQCTKFPELWPQGLLQMACFSGRNSGFVDKNVSLERWRISNPASFFDRAIEGLFDHGRQEHIVAVHLLKTTLAGRAEIAEGTADEAGGDCLLPALTAFSTRHCAGATSGAPCVRQCSS